MLKSSSPFLIAVSLLTLGAAFSAQAVAPRSTYYAPTWLKSGRPAANESYLAGVGVHRERTLNDEIFDPDASRAMREEYDNRIFAEEARDRAGLTEGYEVKTRFSAMRDFANRAVDTMSRIRAKLEGDKIAKNAMNSNLPRAPIAVAVLAASLYTGRSMNIKVFKDRPISSRVVLKDRNGSLSMPLASGFTTSVAYNFGAPLSAQLSKQVTENVSAVVDSSEKGKGSVVYSVSF